jgi:hypothetical protein
MEDKGMEGEAAAVRRGGEAAAVMTGEVKNFVTRFLTNLHHQLTSEYQTRSETASSATAEAIFLPLPRSVSKSGCGFSRRFRVPWAFPSPAPLVRSLQSQMATDALCLHRWARMGNGGT